MKKHDLIIIGSGISGLSLAHYAAREGMDVLVLEKATRMGGTFYSHKFKMKDSSFWVEMGVHTCYNSYQNFINVIEDCQIKERILARQKIPFRLLVDNKIKSISSQINFLEAGLRFWKFFTGEKAGASVRDFYSQIVGPKNYQNVFTHLFSAVPSQVADNFPAEILFKKRERRKDILKKYTLQGGLQTVTDAISDNKKIKIHLKKEVLSIDFSKKLFRIKTRDKKQFEAEAIALATPAHVASILLKKISPDLYRELAKIKTAKVDSVGVAIKKDLVKFEEMASVIPLEDDFYSVVSRDTVPDPNYRGFTFHFRGDRFTKEEQLGRITNFLGISKNQFSDQLFCENIVPSPRAGHRSVVQNIETFLVNQRILLTGNYFHGMSVEDCVSRSLSEFDRLKEI